MRLQPGAPRELHWHAIAAEWAYVIGGRCRVTVIAPSGDAEISDFHPGDVWYFPKGHGHSIQGPGPVSSRSCRKPAALSSPKGCRWNSVLGALLDSLDLKRGAALLDAGCGTGVVSLLAVERCAEVTGFDASPLFIDIARTRCPEGNFIVGDLRAARYVPTAVDAVREAARVLRSGGRVAIAIFDVVEKCEGTKPIAAILSLLPQADPSSPGPFALSNAGQLEGIIRKAGLECESIRSVDVPWHYRDLEAARRAFTSAGPSQQVRELGLGAQLADALDTANAEFLQPDGTYLLRNSFLVVVARKAAYGYGSATRSNSRRNCSAVRFVCAASAASLFSSEKSSGSK